MNGKDAQKYLLHRIRLVNFHNFTDETIEVRDGGHLFLLGDNASGKTTVLDAIHLALTAGQEMELNSAARVAGARAEGRRVQGVILRYNVETGPLNSPGTITYVALEILGRQRRPMTIGLGLTARAKDEKVHRWGIVRECPLEEIPFTVEEKGKRRPTTMREMHDFFGKSTGFYGRMSAYRREVSQRLFGGEESFGAVCHLMSMGKAYREIVSHSADYHELFKALLPEPKTELFERLINALKELDESRAELERLEDRHEYLAGLNQLVHDIGSTRRDCERLKWLERYFGLVELRKQSEKYQKMRAAREEKFAAVEETLTQCRATQKHHEQRLADLKAADVTGLVGKEKDLVSDLEEAAARSENARKALHSAQKATRQVAKRVATGRDGLKDAMHRLQLDLTRLSPALPFSLTKLTNALDRGARSDTAEVELERIPFSASRKQAVEALREPEQHLGILQHCLEQKEADQAAVDRELRSMLAKEEYEPPLPRFREALHRLQRELVNVRPVFAGLEWAPGTSRETMVAIEEAIGVDVLGTFLVPVDDYETARKALFRDFPALRLATGTAELDLPEWIRINFDVPNSDPHSLRCLAAEMETRRGPKVNPFQGDQILLFRDHERRLRGDSPLLIGSGQRREAQRQAVASKREALAALAGEIQELACQKEECSQGLESLAAFVRVVDDRAETLELRARDLRRAVQDLAHVEKETAESKRNVGELNRHVKRLDQRLREVRALIAKQGLDKLEGLIRGAHAQLAKLRKEESGLNKQLGAIENQLQGLGERESKLAAEQRETLVALEQMTEALHASCPEVLDIGKQILDEFRARNVASLEVAESEQSRLARQQAEYIGELRERLKHPEYSAVFAFSYDDGSTELLDRGSHTIGELTEDLHQAIAEQREVINEKTYELFRKIIMEGLLAFLKTHVARLNEMIKRINGLLADREFGRSHYRFQLKEIDKYKRLLEIVRSFNPFDTGGEEELREFFEDHKEEIFDTEVNEIPDVLDYRNWFHYDMKVRTLDRDGVLMDRRTKSLGSGGEQAVPNYLLILTVAHFLFSGSDVRLHGLIFDEAFYGIDVGRRDQILGFATDLGLQLFVASPDQDGVKREVAYSSTVLVVKDEHHDVHLYPYHWVNPLAEKQLGLLPEYRYEEQPIEFGDEL